MSFNCKRIFICGMNIQQQLYQRYFDSLYSHLLNHLPKDWIKDTLNNNFLEVTQKELVAKVKEDKSNVGICLTGAGMIQSSMLNQQQGIRAAVVHNQYIAKMCRQHNDANICVIATDCIGEKLCADLVLHYLQSGFDGQVKNKHRLGLIEGFEQKMLNSQGLNNKKTQKIDKQGAFSKKIDDNSL